MKLGLKMAAHGWIYHAAGILICLMFVSGIGSNWLALALNGLLLVALWGMVFNDGAYNGERACTLAASLDKQTKEGRQIDERLKAQVYDKRVAAWALIIGMLPMMLVAAANLIAEPFFPEPAFGFFTNQTSAFCLRGFLLTFRLRILRFLPSAISCSFFARSFGPIR